MFFVVPPNRFEKFSQRKYTFPETKDRRVKTNEEVEGVCEVERSEGNADKSNAKLIREVSEWVNNM